MTQVLRIPGQRKLQSIHIDMFLTFDEFFIDPFTETFDIGCMNQKFTAVDF